MAEKAVGEMENAVCLYSLTRFNEAATVKKKKKKDKNRNTHYRLKLA